MNNKFLLIFFLFTFKTIGDDCDCCNCLNFYENEENDILDNENDILDNEYLFYFKFEEYKNNPKLSEETENDTIDIFLCIDDAFVYPCLVTIKSIIDKSEHKDLLSFFILVPEKFESTKYIEKFKKEENCKIQIISMGDKYNKLSKGRRWATPTYYRFSIPWITKKKKAIYLDSDLLIRKDIKNLFDIDLEGYYYAAVVDGSANKEHTLPNLKGVIIIIEEGNYYNSGVLLLNCDKIREEMPATFADLLLNQEKKKSYQFLDQDILNIACYNKIKKLTPEYNFALNAYYGGMLGTYENSGIIYTEKEEEFNSAQKDATIVHFIRPKPWEGEYNSTKTKEKDENFQQWLNNINLNNITEELEISEEILNSQKVTIVEKYYQEWKELAGKVATKVYENN